MVRRKSVHSSHDGFGCPSKLRLGISITAPARDNGQHEHRPKQARQSSTRRIERAKALLENPAVSVTDIATAVGFADPTFRYRIDGQEVLHDVSFDVPAGQTVGIVGPSGSGKSTFAKPVQRLYVPESGRVPVDGMDLAIADLAWLRRQIGVVLQENVLFNRSVRENIALADPAMPMERIVAAARLAGAHDFILELSEGYDTVVGERGSTLGIRLPESCHARRSVDEVQTQVGDHAAGRCQAVGL
jgi:ABC-type multidrug transport system fused ATPase/permease subunit